MPRTLHDDSLTEDHPTMPPGTAQDRVQPETRKSGQQCLLERFPDARPLWTLAAPDREDPNAFTLTAYAIDGRVVILQEFTDHRRGSWDVYLPASDSNRVDETLDAIAQPAACRSKQCSYYQHYLAYGPADLTHEGYHAAEAKCIEAQKRVTEWMETHPTGQPPRHLVEFAGVWEQRVRA